MPKPTRIVWPVSDLAAVCLYQTRADAGNLLINGTLSSNQSLPEIRAEFPGICRQITLESAGNLAGVLFTISGIGDDGQLKTTAINGPNANTVNTGANLFSKITSVHVSAAVAFNVRVGTGLVGATRWYLSDYLKVVDSLVVSVNVVANVINYTFQTTFDDPTTGAAYSFITPIDGVTIPTIPTATSMVARTVSCTANYTIPTRYSRVYINSSDATGNAVINFMQQGYLG